MNDRSLTISPRWLVLIFCALLLCCCSGRNGEDPLSFKNAGLLIVSIDTLRADRLGCYGNPRGLTPTLDRLAEEGVLFEEFFANSPKTASSHMSLFTSLLPTVHGVTNFSRRQQIPLVSLADNRLTLGQVLKRNGYWNAAVACGGNLQGAMGFKKGFEGRFFSTLMSVEKIVEQSLQVAKSASQQEKPPFLFVHTYQVHAPYMPPPEFRERFASEPRGTAGRLMEELKDLGFGKLWNAMHSGLWDHKDEFGPEDAAYLSELYDGEVAYTDQVLGTLFDGLRELGLFDEMIVVVLSDHGEEFLEHGAFEHDQLYGEHLHVPVIIRLPGGRLGGSRVKGTASLIDIMPTLLELLDLLGPEKQMMGRSLVTAMSSGRTNNLPILAERVMYADDYQAAMRSRDTNLVFEARAGSLAAFDLKADPEEKRDVAWKADFFPEASKRLLKTLNYSFSLRSQWDQQEAGKEAQLDAAALEELTQLGYIDTQAKTAENLEGSPLDHWPRTAPEGN